MEIIQGKATDKKIVIAQEIAFAKVLAGNNKTLRDRAVKKLRKWLTVRGNGKWAFTEEEFLRIWTGLFYCMWMSDKFLVQEELAESISHLIHCFKRNSESALLFIKCFNKRILMDWEGLDQYRIDKFNMLVRRFLRQTFVYMREKEWDESLLHKLMGIFFNVVLHRDNSLGFVLHFISIYAEELAKVSKGKLPKSTVLILIEPFIRLLARTKDKRIQKEAEDFFIYLMKQTDTGIEFEEKFDAWRQQGFPGEGPHCMRSTNITEEDERNGCNGMTEDDEDDLGEDEDDELISQDEPLDPRAGSVHVYLPQIPIDIDGLISLFKKHQNSKFSTNKGRKILKSLTQKYGALRRGKFPVKIKKDPILNENLKKKRLALKNARKLIEFTEKINEGPIKTKEFRNLNRMLENQVDSDSEVDEEEVAPSDIEIEYEIEQEEEELKQLVDEGDESEQPVEEVNNKTVSKKQKRKKKKKEKAGVKDVKTPNESMQEVKENHKENGELRKKKKKKKKKKLAEQKTQSEDNTTEVVVKTKKVNGLHQGKKDSEKVNGVVKTGKKRKILSNWQVQELDSSSPEYYDIKTQKVIRLEKKICDGCCEENEAEEKQEEKETPSDENRREEILPEFWAKATQKVNKKIGNKNKVFLNPFADLQNESKSTGRRISFALDKNMAQENEQYLEEVKNSPKVPFDSSKKPIQSALKSGLAPSPVNPFYRFKKIKF